MKVCYHTENLVGEIMGEDAALTSWFVITPGLMLQTPPASYSVLPDWSDLSYS